jgi:hypothetical protein
VYPATALMQAIPFRLTFLSWGGGYAAYCWQNVNLGSFLNKLLVPDVVEHYNIGINCTLYTAITHITSGWIANNKVSFQ